MDKYKKAGVDIELQNKLLLELKKDTFKLKKERVISGIGGFGGLYSFPFKNYKNPVLVSSCDGVGTKILLGLQANKLEVLGYDLVCHCINDILVQGTVEPLFFLDYFGCQSLNSYIFKNVLNGIIKACAENGLVLLGGETAELSGMYPKGIFDLVGFIIGVVERTKILPKKNLKEGDLIIGLPSTGLHTNGYTLLRKILKDKGFDLEEKPYPLKEKLKSAILKPHICYLNVLKRPILENKIKALAHITGGGFIDNIPRVLPKNLNALIKTNSWEVLPIFEFIKREGKIQEEEMYKVFNMGIGMCAIVSKENLKSVLKYFDKISQKYYTIGELKKGKGRVVFK